MKTKIIGVLLILIAAQFFILRVYASGDIVWQQTLNTCTCLEFSPDNKLLVSGNSYISDNGDFIGSIDVWDVEGDSLINEINELSPLNSICFSHDGNYLATGCRDGYIRIWDTHNWNIITSIDSTFQELNFISSLQFSQNDSLLVIGGNKKGLLIYKTKNWQLIKQIDSFPYNYSPQNGIYQPLVNNISISYDDNYIAFSGNSGPFTFIYNIQLDSIVEQINNSCEPKFSPVSHKLLMKYWDNWYAIPNKGLIYKNIDTRDSIYLDITGLINEFAFSPDGNKISVANETYTIQIWNLNNYKLDYTYSFWGGSHRVLANSYDGNYIADYAGRLFLINARWDITEIKKMIQNQFKLNAYPNPSNTKIIIEFTLPISENIDLDLIDINGSTTKIISNSYFNEGSHTKHFNIQSFTSGSYCLRLRHGNKIETFNFVITK